MESLGKYEIREKIGQGGMGSVYRAHDPVIGRDVALKIIREHIFEVPEVKKRFYREAKSAGRLSHENIMVIHDVGEQDGKPYIVMEYLPGTDLRQMLDDGDNLELGEQLRIATQICRGLKYAHDHKVVHRDIKPENIRILKGNRVKILDFGIARLGSETITISNSSLGTPRYMSPEQITGDSVDHRTDIFSFGVLLYELLSGKNPFSGTNISSISYKIVHEEPDPIYIGEARLDEDLQSIVSKCLAKDQNKRYQDFSAVIVDLERAASRSRDPELTPEASSGSGRSKVLSLWSWAGIAAVVLVGAAFLIIETGSSGNGESDQEAGVPTVASDTEPDSVSMLALGSAIADERSRMLEAERRAVAASADDLAEALFDEASTAKDAAEQAILREDDEGYREALDNIENAVLLFERATAEARRSSALSMQQEASAERGRLLERRPGITENSQFRSAEELRRSGEAQLRDEAYEDAAGSFSEARSTYAALGASSTDNGDGMRVEAARARSRMEADRRSVDAERGVAEVAALFREADARVSQAENAEQAGRYEAAVREYEAAEDIFGTIAERLEQRQTRLDELRRLADDAHAGMQTEKNAVDTDQQESDAFSQGLEAESDGDRAFDEGQYEEAAGHFQRAGSLYAESSDTAQPVSPEDEIRPVVENTVRQTEAYFASENLSGLQGISDYYSSDAWNSFFDVADDINARVRPSGPVFDGNRAVLTVEVQLEFQDHRSRQQENTFVQRWTFARGGDGWDLIDVEAAN